MKFFAKVKEVGTKIVNVFKREKVALLAATTTVMASPVGVMAIDSDLKNIKWKQSTGTADMSTLIGSIIGLMLTIARYAGAALLVWGVVKTVMAYKDDNVNEITQGIRLAVVGAIMIAMKSVLVAMGLI